jgi:hypothetical protein
VTAVTVSPLPPDVVLLHVGPYKTGTTALQGAFHTGRERLAELGVHYAGAGRQPMLAALAMTGRPGRRGDPAASKRHWQDLCDDVRAARGKRIVVSSEFFSDASPEAAAQVVEGLGGDRVHVVVTLRPLGKLMPSQWQQYVQNGLRMRYSDWLDHMFNKPPYDKPTPTFWNRHDQANQVARWTQVVGPDRVTVVALDEADRGMLLRTFEAMLDLPTETLVPDNVSNRSLTLGEVEVVRLLNEEFRRRKWGDDLYGRFVRTGIAKKMLTQRRPQPGEPAITTPKWAQERAAERGAAAGAAITASGVNVIGDLASLGTVVRTESDDEEPPLDPPLPASAAAIALVGTIIASRKAVWPNKKADDAAPVQVTRAIVDLEDETLESIDTVTLAKVLAARVRRRLGIKARARMRR